MNPEKMSKTIQEWTRASLEMRKGLTSEEFTQVLLTWLESASPETLDHLLSQSTDEEEEDGEREQKGSSWLRSVLKFSAKTFFVAFVLPPAISVLMKRIKGVYISSAPCGCGGSNFSFISQKTGTEMFSLHVGGGNHGGGDPEDDLEDPGPKNDDEPEPEPEDEN